MKTNILLTALLILNVGQAQAGVGSELNPILFDKTVPVQEQKQQTFNTSVQELGKVQLLSFPGSDKVQVLASFESALSPIYDMILADMTALGADVRSSQAPSVLGFGMNFVQVSANQKESLLAGNSELLNLAPQSPISILLGYNLSKRTIAILNPTTVSCNSSLLATLRFSVREPTEVLSNVTFEVSKPVSSILSYAIVNIRGDVDAAKTECLAKLQ